MNEQDMLVLLEKFMRAFNDHDADALMRCMTDDCVFFTAAGNGPEGNVLRGRAAVKAGFEAIWKKCPDARWSNGKHAVAGNRGFSEWRYTGSAVDGSGSVAVNGVDIFTFKDGKIHVKDSYRKQVTA